MDIRPSAGSDSNAVDADATIRLMGADLDPAVVSDELGIEPSSGHRNGDVNEHNPSVQYRSGMWALTSESHVDGTELNDHLAWLLHRFAGKAPALDQLRGRGIVQASDAFCYWVSQHGHGGPPISPEVLSGLGELGLTLAIDFYDGSEWGA